MNDCGINNNTRISSFIQNEFSNCKTIDEVIKKYSENLT